MVVREDFLSVGFRASNEVVVIAEMGDELAVGEIKGANELIGDVEAEEWMILVLD